VWGNLWTADRVAKYDPSKGEWTMFDLPVRGTEIRHVSLLERDGARVKAAGPGERELTAAERYSTI